MTGLLHLRHLRSTRLRLLAGEAGQALIMALLVMIVLVVASTSVATVITSNQTNSSRERQVAQALDAGEAGLDLAANAVTTAGGCSGSPSGNATVDGSAVSWSASSSGSACLLNSTTRSPGGRVTRVLQEQMAPTTSETPGGSSAIWGYGFVMGGSPHSNQSLTPDQICSTSPQLPTTTYFGNGAGITVPAWITTDVCKIGGGPPSILNPSSGSPIAVHIGGSLYSESTSYSIGYPSGTSTGPVASAAIVGGCWANFHGWQAVACDDAGSPSNGYSGVFASDYHPTEPTPTPTMPTFDSSAELSIYDDASPGPLNPCGSDSTGTIPSNLFDNNSTPDTSLGTKDFDSLFGMSHSFDCITSDGELKWTPCTHTLPCYNGDIGTLLVKGTIFIDANLTFGSGNTDYVEVDPDTDGSIYVDGYIAFSSSGSLGGDAPTWSSPSSIPNLFLAAYDRDCADHPDGIDMTGNSRFEGVLFSNCGFYLDNSAQTAGSVFADYGTIVGDGHFRVTTEIPEGSLGGTTTTEQTTWGVAPRTWRECPVTGCS